METITLSRSDANPDIQDEAALVEVARRDPEAFAVLYQRYLTPVYRYLLRRSNSVHEAEDLSAQVFIEALEGLTAGRYRQGGCFAAWLFTITRRRLVDFYRQRPTAPLGDPPSPEPSEEGGRNFSEGGKCGDFSGKNPGGPFRQETGQPR